MRPRALFDYDTVLACWRLLAEAATDLKLMDAEAAEASETWLEEAHQKLLLLTDQLEYDDIVGDGELTGPAMLIAQLEGWCMTTEADSTGGSRGYDTLAIEADSDSDTFESGDAAVAFVRARAVSDEPGTKLHQIALSLVEEIA